MPAITVKHAGPQSQQGAVGDVVAFVVQIINPNNRPLSNLKVIYRFDPALVPKFATDNYQIEGGSLVWVIPLLPAGNASQIEVRCQCGKETAKACNTVRVSTSEGAQAQADAYLEIRPASGLERPGGASPGETVRGGMPSAGGTSTGENKRRESLSGGTSSQTPPPSSPLTMTVADLRGPVSAGKDLIYEIRVSNNGSAVQRQVTVTAMVPEGMMPAPLGTTGPGPTQFNIDHQAVRFNQVMEVQPGETLTYRVHVRTKSAGQFAFHVEFTSQNIAQPIVQEVTTEVFEQGRGK